MDKLRCNYISMVNHVISISKDNHDCHREIKKEQIKDVDINFGEVLDKVIQKTNK